MNVLKKLITAFKSAANEMGENIVDANGILIIEQEITDAKQELKKAKEVENRLVADKKRTEAKVNELTSQITDNENAAKAALDKGEEGLALQVAERIVDLESQLSGHNEVLDALNKQSADISQQINKAQLEVRNMETDLEQIKITDCVQKAQEKIHSNASAGSSKVASAKQSLERIKAKQRYNEDLLEAKQELETESDLDAKLQQAGIVSNPQSTESVLERIKAKAD